MEKVYSKSSVQREQPYLMGRQQKRFFEHIAQTTYLPSKTQTVHRNSFWRENPEWKLFNTMLWAKRAHNEGMGLKDAIEEDYIDGFTSYKSLKRFVEKNAPLRVVAYVAACRTWDRDQEAMLDEAMRITEEFVDKQTN